MWPLGSGGEGNRRDGFATVFDLHHHRRGFEIVIVNVVVDCLEVPGQLAGCRMQHHQRVAKEPITWTIATVEIGRGTPEG